MLLTRSQKHAKIAINKWFKSSVKYKRPFKLGGAAGTGKTFLINHILEEWGIPYHKILVMAYTGQAVSVLRRRGVKAFTIHSQIKELHLIDKTDERGNVIHRDGIPYKMKTWKTIEELGYNYELILVDEASFVDISLAKDIESFGIPVLYIGDHEQLDPVAGRSSFTREQLDFELVDPMRQALDSPLLRYLTDIRLENKIIPSSYESDVYFIKGKGSMDRTMRRFHHLIKDSSITITATNKQRQIFTNEYRKHYYMTDNPIPVSGEKLISRRNRWNYKLGDYPLVNGTIGYSLYDIPLCDIDYRNKTFQMDFQPNYIKFDYYDNMTCDLDFLMQPFGDKEVPHYRNFNLMEHASAISTHLSQGAQFKSVLFIPSPTKHTEYEKKINYTAASRAEKELFILIDA